MVVARVDKVLGSSNFGNMPPRYRQAGGDTQADKKIGLNLGKIKKRKKMRKTGIIICFLVLMLHIFGVCHYGFSNGKAQSHNVW